MRELRRRLKQVEQENEITPVTPLRSRPPRRRTARIGGRVGACADNAAMESFFSPLQKNVLNRPRSATRLELRLAIVTYIPRTYHRRRRQDALGA